MCKPMQLVSIWIWLLSQWSVSSFMAKTWHWYKCQYSYLILFAFCFVRCKIHGWKLIDVVVLCQYRWVANLSCSCCGYSEDDECLMLWFVNLKPIQFNQSNHVSNYAGNEGSVIWHWIWRHPYTKFAAPFTAQQIYWIRVNVLVTWFISWDVC
jgi:hypothetical protein